MEKRGLIERLREYINDSSRNLKDRAFMLFSITVLISLFLAVPCGWIMKEPLSATISTLVGAVAFTVYVIYSFKTEKIARAKVVISIVLVFFFLPGMFFTNGGVNGGATVWLVLGTIYITMILEGKFKIVMLIMNAVVSAVSWLLGYYYPELITEYSRAGNFIDTFSALFIVSAILYTIISFQNNLFRKEEEYEHLQLLFKQTATALVNAIDAKDQYTHGHSARVADYSRRIAELSGKSKQECEEIYYAALLHDVGKIGIPVAIINKEGKLTDEEYKVIKQHSGMGAQILQSISEYPYLSIGAHYHHERFDGRGYPDGLKGTDIPELARIIAVADTYDAMTSKRSYRDPIPQDLVREEFVKCAGTQFDPEFSNLMLHLIDVDSEYEMREREEARDLDVVCGEYRSAFTDGIHITNIVTHIRLKSRMDGNHKADHIPTFVLFDSLNGRIQTDERKKKELLYFEYATVRADGTTEVIGARKAQTKVTEKRSAAEETKALMHGTVCYHIDIVRYRDHLLITIMNDFRSYEVIIALPDSARFCYLSLTGEHCIIDEVEIHSSGKEINEDYIPRIAEEISYINVPEGDIPNVQVDGWMTDASRGIEITDGMTISFHSMSLPTARLIWHCPYAVLYTSGDGQFKGNEYRELTVVRLDGEGWEDDDEAENNLYVSRLEDFINWNNWKEQNKAGQDCEIHFQLKDRCVIITTEYCGLSIRSVTTLSVDISKFYTALSGDQCAITNIHIKR